MDEELYDPECYACERAQEDYRKLERVTDDLAALVRRLAHALRESAPDNELPAKAMDYLQREGLCGSPLREAPNDRVKRRCRDERRGMKEEDGSGNVPLERQVRREPFELPVTRYRDNENLVTCAANFETHDVCVFWSCRKFGQLEYCRFTGETLFRRGEEGTGTLIPCDGCPLWNMK